jgi:hypothetical protein
MTCIACIVVSVSSISSSRGTLHRLNFVLHNVCYSIGMNLVSSEHSLLTTKALGAQKKFATKMKFILVDREPALKDIW